MSDIALASDIDDAASDAARSVRSRRLVGVAERWALVGLLVVVVVVMSIAEPDLYPTTANLRATAASQAVLAVCALAVLIPLLAGQFDLSVGAISGLAAMVVAASLGTWDLPPAAAIVVGIAVGALVGLINGLLVTRLSIDSLVVTLGMVSLIRGVLERYAGGKILLEGIPSSLKAYGSVLPEHLWLGLPRIVFVMAAVAVVVWWLVEHTPWGRSVGAVGTNASAANLVGLRVDRIVVGAFVASGTLAGVAGVLSVAYSGQGNPAVGPNFTLPALAAAFLGAAAVRPGRYNVGGTMIAIYFLAATVSGLNYLGLGRGVEALFNGVALLVGVGLSGWLGRRRVG